MFPKIIEILEKFLFFVYSISVVIAVTCFFYSISFAILGIFVPGDSNFIKILLFTGICSGIVFCNLRYFGHKYLNFKKHENIFEYDILVKNDVFIDVRSHEDYNRWQKMKELISELGDKDYSKLTEFQKRLVKEALLDVIDEDNGLVENENLDGEQEYGDYES